jgi:putative spermidine/putrescine transport system substrate-binding protein
MRISWARPGRLRLMSAVTAAAITLAACGGGAPSPGPASPGQPPRGGSITYMNTAGGANFETFWAKMVPKASQELGTDVKYVAGAGPEAQQRLAAGAADIDVILLKPDTLANMLDSGLKFVTLTDHEQEIPNIKLVDPSELKEALGVPTNGTAAPFWRDQFGILYDSAKIPDPPSTWQEFFDRRNEWAGHIGTIRMDAKSGGGRLMLRDFLIGFGVDFSKPLDELRNSPEWKSATEKFTEFSKAFSQPLAPDPTVMYQQFKQGNVWITEYAIDFTLWARGQGLVPDTIKTTFFPSGHYGGHAYLAIPESVSPEQRQRAFAFTNWLLSVDTQVTMMNQMWQYMGIEKFDAVSEEVWENIPRWEEIKDARLLLENAEAFNYLKEHGTELVAGQ